MSKYTSIANPIGTRLKTEMRKRGFTSAELARRADVLTSFIYDIISGKSTNPSTVKLARISDALNINLAYLVRGDDTNNEKNYGRTQDYYTDIPHMMINPSNDGEKIVSCKNKDNPYHFNKEWVRSHLNTEISNLRIITINGDSMEPALYHQDIALIDISKQTPSPPSIFIIFDGLGLTPKRLEYFTEPNRKYIRIKSDNKHYSTYECSISELTIVGRVVWFSREI